MRYSNDAFHYMLKAEFLMLVSSKVPSGLPSLPKKYQRNAFKATEPLGLGVKHKLLPEYLRDLGYSTHMIGK